MQAVLRWCATRCEGVICHPPCSHTVRRAVDPTSSSYNHSAPLEPFQHTRDDCCLWLEYDKEFVQHSAGLQILQRPGRRKHAAPQRPSFFRRCVTKTTSHHLYITSTYAPSSRMAEKRAQEITATIQLAQGIVQDRAIIKDRWLEFVEARGQVRLDPKLRRKPFLRDPALSPFLILALLLLQVARAEHSVRAALHWREDKFMSPNNEKLLIAHLAVLQQQTKAYSRWLQAVVIELSGAEENASE